MRGMEGTNLSRSQRLSDEGRPSFASFASAVSSGLERGGPFCAFSQRVAICDSFSGTDSDD